MKKSLVGFAILGFSSPALAGWEYTQWGMSAKEVAAASNGAVSILETPVPGANMLIEAEGMYWLEGKYVPARFFFDEDRLQMVRLKMTGDPACWSVRRSLESEYGRPFSDTPTPVMSVTKWHNQDQGDTIEFSGLGDVCYIKYASIDRPSS